MELEIRETTIGLRIGFQIKEPQVTTMLVLAEKSSLLLAFFISSVNTGLNYACRWQDQNRIYS